MKGLAPEVGQPPGFQQAESVTSFPSEAFSNRIAALAYLPGQCFGGGVIRPSFLEIRDDRFGQVRQTTAYKRFGEFESLQAHP
jgi:hypothetical protein